MPRVGWDGEAPAGKSAEKALMSGKTGGTGSWTRSRDIPVCPLGEAARQSHSCPVLGNEEEEEEEEEGHHAGAAPAMAVVSNIPILWQQQRQGSRTRAAAPGATTGDTSCATALAV